MVNRTDKNKTKTNQSLFDLKKSSFEMFTVLVESEFTDIYCRFFKPYEVAVRFKKSHCPDFYFFRHYLNFYFYPRKSFFSTAHDGQFSVPERNGFFRIHLSKKTGFSRDASPKKTVLRGRWNYLLEWVSRKQSDPLKFTNQSRTANRAAPVLTYCFCGVKKKTEHAPRNQYGFSLD